VGAKSPLTTGGVQLIRQMNRRAVLDLIRTQGPIGQPEIARLTSLTPATVLSIIAELEEEGLVVEERSPTAAGERRAGRPARLYAFNVSHGFVIGVDISTDEVEALLTNLAIQVLARATAAADGTREGILRAVLTTIQEVIERAGVERKQVLGIGLAMRGLADIETGEVVWHPQWPLEGWPLVPLVSEATGLPAALINNARGMALAEHHFGVARDLPNVVYLNVGRGIGAGLVLGGQLYLGGDGWAGEVGHTTVDEDGPRCACGNYGCLEALAANPAIVRRALKGVRQGAQTALDPDHVTVEAIVALAQGGDSFARSLVEQTGRYVGVGVANLVNLLNPNAVVIGGLITEAGDLFFEAVRHAVQVRALQRPAHSVRILPTNFGRDASAIGAATLALLRAGILN